MLLGLYTAVIIHVHREVKIPITSIGSQLTVLVQSRILSLLATF